MIYHSSFVSRGQSTDLPFPHSKIVEPTWENTIARHHQSLASLDVGLTGVERTCLLTDRPLNAALKTPDLLADDRLVRRQSGNMPKRCRIVPTGHMAKEATIPGNNLKTSPS